MIIFISGGARSGKSHFAEETALSLYNRDSGTLYYLATAKKSDDEMDERIYIHQQDRDEAWVTVEEAYHLEQVLESCVKEDVILIDCLTIWLSNVMFELDYTFRKLEEEVNHWLKLAHEKQFHLVIVSNDVTEGIPFSNKDVLKYMYGLQYLHKLIVEKAELAVEVQAGLPTYWKGEGI